MLKTLNCPQSPVTSPQSPVPSPQSPVTSHQSPVPSPQSPVPNIYQFLHPPLGAVSVSPLKP
ncbi:MAG: hypothetical protein ACKPBB_23710 [Sphaerospermopsis kisseleviana]